MQSELELFDGDLLSDLTVFGQNVDAWVQPIKSEVLRRRDAMLGAILDPEILRTLRLLPFRMPVATSELGPIDMLILEDAPPGAVEHRTDAIIRLAEPPLQIMGIVKRAACWEDIQAVSLLRTHAPRFVEARHNLAIRAMREADSEIGVVDSGDKGAVLRKAGRRWLKPSWQRWLISEIAFDRWQRSS